MRVVLLARDLITASRVAEAAARAGVELVRVEDPGDLPLPTSVQLLLVDWAERRRGWGDHLVGWSAQVPEAARPRIVLFGPHADLAAHAEARAAGLAPMRARSKFFSDLTSLFG